LHCLEKYELIILDALREFYTKNSLAQKSIDKRTLSDTVLKQFKGRIATWSPKYSSAFLLFNNEIEKGKIIEIMCKKIDDLKKSTRLPSINDQINNVGKAVKNEIKRMSHTYSRLYWPIIFFREPP